MPFCTVYRPSHCICRKSINSWMEWGNVINHTHSSVEHAIRGVQELWRFAGGQMSNVFACWRRIHTVDSCLFDAANRVMRSDGSSVSYDDTYCSVSGHNSQLKEEDVPGQTRNRRVCHWNVRAKMPSIRVNRPLRTNSDDEETYVCYRTRSLLFLKWTKRIHIYQNERKTRKERKEEIDISMRKNRK